MPARGQTVPAEQRFWAKVERRSNGCWIWTGARHPFGYGYFCPDGRRSGERKNVRAHRFAYEILVGPIPSGLVLDHLCEVPACVNPDHLKPVSNGENTRRGVGPTAENARKTHCKRGHLLAGANLRIYRGRRCCRACRREQHEREYWGLEIHLVTLGD